jgi:hypothetical protein
VTQVVYQRETDDWRGFAIIQDGQPYAGAWSYQIVAKGARPSGSWQSAVTRGVAKGVDIQNLAAGYYSLFIRVDIGAPYAPVLDPIDLVMK